MKEFVVSKNEANQRFDKYLQKRLKEAPKSFIYKMLRKKNITLNGKKALGDEKLAEGDMIRFFLADETFEKFAGNTPSIHFPVSPSLKVIYEDNNVIFFNKPVGMLSQKAKPEDISANEYMLGYLLKNGAITNESLQTFKPAICNRLDRNTSGLLIGGKSLAGLQQMSSVFRDRSLEKYYLALVAGTIEKAAYLKGYLVKNASENKVMIYQKPVEGAAFVETAYEPLAYNADITLLKVHLISGKPHQIRAHLSSISHPVIGDVKYGFAGLNRRYKEKMHITSQQLHAYEVILPKMQPPLEGLSGKCYKAVPPKKFLKLLEETKWEHGTQEVFEVLHLKNL